MTTLGYTAATVLEFMIEGHLTGIMGRRRMSKELSRLNGHFVVCGYGRVGQEVARSFAAHKAPFVALTTRQVSKDVLSIVAPTETYGA